MAVFSFDISASYDHGEMLNAIDQAKREIDARYDFKGTHAALEWLEDKKGLKIYGDAQFQLDAIIEIVRKKAAARSISQKTFVTSKEPETTNLRMSWIVPFKDALSQDDAKEVTKVLRESLPKLKTQIQGTEIRVMSPKKDELQAAMQLLRTREFSFPVSFKNFR